MIDVGRLRAAYEKVRDELLAERTAGGYWVGELSSSALSTATAVSALAVVKAATIGRGAWVQGDALIARGVAWLVQQQNEDGGFGDTDLSHSNIATTYLVVAALHLAGVAEQHAELIHRANAYIDAKGRLNGLRQRYGIDKTFVVPIMTNLALAGLVDWREVDPLPFELACVPQSLYRFVGMPVVSYAIPALVAIGQARYFHAPPRNPFIRFLRSLSLTRSLKVLRRMQPDSGGYLEATPLTSFVVMSLASVTKPRPVAAVYGTPSNDQTAITGRGFADEVIHNGVGFLFNSVRPDGSWPIDTNLATWNTTLAINALAGAGEDVAELLGAGAVGNALRGVPRPGVDADLANPGTAQRPFPTGSVIDWLLSCQHTKRHPFTGADPGGFGWSDLSGAVPDADDTAGAILALSAWQQWSGEANSDSRDIDRAVTQASQWLLRLRNRDGGWPTFCRGWGKLPFDRSGADLTAHVVRVGPAITAVGDSQDWLRYLNRSQHTDGSWSPLWFGNQDHPNEENPVYGTARVLMAYRDLGLMDSTEAQRGVAWLVVDQHEDGGWGSGVWDRKKDEGGRMKDEAKLKFDICNLRSSVEETALAVEALLAANDQKAAGAVSRGLAWLVQRVENNEHRQPAPIGFYFAKLWYYERLYPLTFTVAALGRACRQFAHPTPLTEIPTKTAPSDTP